MSGAIHGWWCNTKTYPTQRKPDQSKRKTEETSMGLALRKVMEKPTSDNS